MTEMDETLQARLAPAAPDAEEAAALARLQAVLARRAVDEDLLDVAYRDLDTPLGRLLLAATPAGLVRVAFPVEDADAVLASLADQVSPRVLRAPRRLDEVARELDEYFAGRRHAFDVPVDLQLARGFRRAVLEKLVDVPYARTVSYAELAARTGQPAGGPGGRHRVRAEPRAPRRPLPPGGALGRHAGRPTAAAPTPSAGCSPWRRRPDGVGAGPGTRVRRGEAADGSGG